jgi:D-alanine-D-alanine ligase-like ATP-grasp enzyme
MVALMKNFSISSKYIIEEAEKMWFKIEMLSEDKNLFYVKWNDKEILFKSTDFGWNSALWYKLCDDKELTYKVLDKHNLPIAKSEYISKLNFSDFSEDTVSKLDFPLIVKPIDEWHWNWVLMWIGNFEELKKALRESFEIYDDMIIQEQANWDEIRVLVIKWKIIAAIHRVPAFVIWDWENNISKLIDIENNTNPFRWEWYDNSLAYIKIDSELLGYIWKNNLDLDYVALKWEKIQLRWNSNLWTWWIPVDVTELISDDIKNVAIVATKVLWMEICWVDILTSDFTKSLSDTKWIVLECNATPWFSPIWKEKTKKALEVIFD